MENSMETQIIGLLAETFIHPGIGRTEGVVDLPVAREAATDYPYIPGSSIKGALRDYARGHWPDQKTEESGDSNRRTPHVNIRTCFGEHTNAGGILISDARLLLLPVRSLTGSYRWVTSPHLLERFQRDLARSNQKIAPSLPEISLSSGQLLGEGSGILFLEERTFSYAGPLPAGVTEAISPLIKHDKTKKRITGQLVILNDDDFAWFARYSLSVQARNVLNEETKVSENLWYEESLPPDSLFYTLLTPRVQESGLDKIQTLIENNAWLQTGGNETVGQGWMAMQTYGNKVKVKEGGVA